MGFFAPVFLFLLSLASIPFIIHLIQRIRLKKVYYSSLFFLTETKRETFSWLQIKEILLLIFRTLFIFFLFFSLARPYLRKKIFSNQYEASRVIILDDSYSMGFNNYFSDAKNTAKKLIQELKKGSEAAILTSSENLKTNLTTSLIGLEKTLDTITVSYSGNTLESIFEEGNALLMNSALPRKEIFIITDLQKRAILPVIDKLSSYGNKTEITIIDISKNNEENAGIEKISLSPNLPTQNFPSKPQVQVKNYSTKSTKRNLLFALQYSEPESLIQNIKIELSLSPKETKTVPLDVEIRKPGTYRARAMLSTDSLRLDDNRFFTITVPEQTPILLMYENPADIQYIEKALKSSYFNVNTANIKTLRQQNLKRYKAIGLFSVTALTYSDWQRIGYYLLEGGGVFIAFNKEIKEPQWTKALNLDLSLTGTEAVIKSPGFVTIERVNYTNPIMEIFRDVDLSTVKFYSYWETDNFSQSQVLAYFSSAKPFLIEGKEKKVLVALTTFDVQSTDFMFKATFLPLIHRIFTFLSFPSFRQEYQVGDTIKTQVLTSVAVKVITPKDEFNQTPVVEEGKTLIKLSDTKNPGFYKIGNESFVVNVLAEEGDLIKISDKELKNQNIKVINSTNGRITDLSRISLLLSILFFILELVLLVI